MVALMAGIAEIAEIERGNAKPERKREGGPGDDPRAP
jgi:hypothetical protein